MNLRNTDTLDCWWVGYLLLLEYGLQSSEVKTCGFGLYSPGECW